MTTDTYGYGESYDPYGPFDADAEVKTDILGTEDAVVAQVEVNIDFADRIVVRGVSRRDPDDRVNNEIGFKLALGRALRQAGRELLRDAQGLVREAARERESQLAATEAARAAKDEAAKREPTPDKIAQVCPDGKSGCWICREALRRGRI